MTPFTEIEASERHYSFQCEVLTDAILVYSSVKNAVNVNDLIDIPRWEPIDR
jgi:hypothetical protein